jgi:hypothetical protein
VEFPTPVPQTQAPAMTTFKFVGLDKRTDSTTLIGGAKISFCGDGPPSTLGFGFDGTCPSSAYFTTTDPKGNATLTIPTANPINGSGYNGYGRIDANGYPTTYFYWGFPISEPELVWGAPFTPSIFVDSPGSAPGTGEVWIGAFDCQGALAGGVRVFATSGSTRIEADYNRGPPPGDASPGTWGGGPGNGTAQFVDLPAGIYAFTAEPIELGHVSSTVNAAVVDGALTIVALAPTP